MRGNGLWPLWFGAWFWFLFGVLVWFGVACVLFPSPCCVSFPFNDDLGTPPTRRPHSWKKHVANVRHVQVDAREMAHCQHLQIVRLQTRVFCSCPCPAHGLAPGCKQFGAQVFEELLVQIGVRDDATNQLAPQAELM